MDFKISYQPPPLEVLNKLTQLPPIPLPFSPPNLTITRRLIFPIILSRSFTPTSPTTFSIKTTSLKPTWNQLTAKIRSQFNIPEDIDFGLTCMGTEDEEMTLSSQEGLNLYFSQYKDGDLSMGNHCSYKFGLMIFPNVEENKKESEKNVKKFEEMNCDISKYGQLGVEIYDDDYNEYYDYDYDEEYLYSRDGCSQQ